MADKGGYIGRNPGDAAVIIARQNFTPTGIQTDFTFNSGYTPGYVDVYLNGVRLIDVQDYVASTGNTVGLTSYANSGDIVEVIAYKAFNVGNVSDATSNFTVGGNLTVSGDTNVSGSSTFVDVNISGATTASGASYFADVTEFVSSGIVTVSNTTDSTSTTTGALLVSGGVGVALSMTVGGSLSVGGTITYEDVTNVDAVGLITARSGLEIGLAGVGGTIKTEYLDNKYVNLKSKGTDYQEFAYPPVTVTINAFKSGISTDSTTKLITPTEDFVATPIARGEIVSGLLYEKGTGYGSTDVINFKNKPIISFFGPPAPSVLYFPLCGVGLRLNTDSFGPMGETVLIEAS